MNYRDNTREELLKELQESQQENMESSAALKKHHKDLWLNRVASGFAYTTSFLGLIVLAGWAFGLNDMSSMGKMFIPMAEETALLFLITGIALALLRRNEKSRILHYFLIGSAVFIGFVALLTLIDFATAYKWNLSDFIDSHNALKGVILTGKMSALTAICFLFVCVALLLLPTKAKKYSVIFSSLILFTGYVIVVGYTYGVPVLYGGTIIPMALPTAIAFIIASAGLLFAAGKETAPIRYFIENSTRARMLRNILPVIFLSMLAHDFIYAFTNEDYSSSSSLINSVVDIVVLLVTSAIISLMSRSIGNSIDKNIKEREKAEKALRESEQKYSSLFNSMLEGFALHEIICDANGKPVDYRFLDMNPAFEQLTGLIKIDVVGKTVLDILPTTESIWIEKYGTVALTGEPIDFENYAGAIGRHFQVTAFSPKKNQFAVFFTDITGRKLAEESLMKLKTAIEKSEVSVVISDSKGNIEYANPFFTELTGYSADEYIGQNPKFLISDYHPTAFYEELWNTINSGHTWEGEFYNRKKNGEMYWENAIISPVENSNKEITHFVAIKTDITEAKKINLELIAAKEHAEESDRLKSAFLANMSHEIRTPMNGILGFSELLKEPGLSGEQQQEYIRIIEKSCARMLNIINDIVDISKIEAGLIKLDMKESNINEQIEYIYTFFKPEVEAKGMKLSFKNTLPAKEATITTDYEKLYAILNNLVKNAIKYTNEGSIEFGYEPVDSHDVETHGHESVQMQFYVKDTGIGIPKDRQDAIFERFIQADILDKMARQGAGLGLSISRAYIQMLGGKIWVESEEGVGSTFYFTLPYNTEPVKKTLDQHLTPSVKIDNVRKLKILIAEDDDVSEMLFDITVRMFGKEFLKARTGIEAVEACQNNPDIDFVLMDIQMPEMNGYEATRQIRQFNKEVVIISQTANALTGDREKAIDAGCNDYIAKPIRKDELLGLIQKYFRK
jgi:PAS domain S-box-containing protein